MFTSKWSFELSREWHFSYLVNSCRYCTAISTDVLWMPIPDESLAKCTLLIQRNPQALTDYHTMLFPPHFIHQTKHAREKADMILKVQSITKHFLVYVLKQVLSDWEFILWKVWSDNRMPADNVVMKHIYHICHHTFVEVITFQGQEKFYFIFHNLSFISCRN